MARSIKTRSAKDFIDSVKSDKAFHKKVERHIRADLFRFLEKEGFAFTVGDLHDLLIKEPGVEKMSEANAARFANHKGGAVPTDELLGLLLYATSKFRATGDELLGRLLHATDQFRATGVEAKVIARGDPRSLRCAPFVAGDPGPAAMAKTRGKKAPWRASW